MPVTVVNVLDTHIYKHTQDKSSWILQNLFIDQLLFVLVFISRGESEKDVSVSLLIYT